MTHPKDAYQQYDKYEFAIDKNKKTHAQNISTVHESHSFKQPGPNDRFDGWASHNCGITPSSKGNYSIDILENQGVLKLLQKFN